MGVHQQQPLVGRLSHDVKGNDGGVPRIPALAATVLLLTPGLSGCALLNDVGDGDFDDALELVPADAEDVTFTNRLATAERLGIDDVDTGADKEEIDGYIETLVGDDASVGATQFAAYLVPMSEGAAFSEFDVVWEATASAGAGVSLALPRIYKMRDDLDLDTVGDDLVDVGYEEDEIAGHRHLFIADVANDTEFEGMIGAYPGAQMADVVVVPDEHLMFVGGGPDALESALEVFEDDADSATDAGTFDDLLEDADDPEYAQLVEDPECVDPSESDPPVAAAFFISGDDAAGTRVRVFDDGSVETDDYSDDDFVAC